MTAAAVASRRAQARGPFLERNFKYLIVAPAILVLLLVGLFPLIYSAVVSFQGIGMIDQDTSFQGLLNYKALFRDARLWESLAHTLIFTAVALPIELALGLLLAHLFLEKLPGRALFIALLTLPTMISPIVSGATWRLLFDHHFGPINQIIAWFAGHQVPIIWIVNPNTVYPAILICEIWQWTPFMFLILLAALSNVDKSLLEAAELDGAPYRTVFRRIVLPAIWPVMSVALMIRGLELMRLFDIIWALTRGGPGTMTETVSIYTYVQGFEQFEISYTAAIAFLVIILLTAVVMWLLKRMEIAR
ncbi:binding-protein-dependent transport systems inner membrane component [Hypericibacter adhaerens]|uniref:Binding-protein-dependent transport systems inner membrane component n=2 Tax=Hypericibacter adhaerens TaxID=2602016 RepID=A0A5J6N319_9PROT|nr:sugar ABC transporter permease [Hypericibacter adhaerens]QEX24372.1 binding-protein-dependent transport systems inner membrane component [Hypericibacter adhaerens]